MEEILTKLLTIYGPLALGWPVAFIIWKRLEIVTEKFISMSKDILEILTRLETKLDVRPRKWD